MLITNSTRKMKKSILAIPAEAVITPPNPKTPAMSAMIKNVIAQVSMIVSSLDLVLVKQLISNICNACAVTTESACQRLVYSGNFVNLSDYQTCCTALAHSRDACAINREARRSNLCVDWTRTHFVDCFPF